MSKLSFRARALDAAKPMPVYMTEELPDLPDFSAINRAVPQMPTGMEKEEESEHHLQRAISAQQVYGSANQLVIPTPDFESSVAYYEQLYDSAHKQPKQYVHVQPLSMEQDIPDYDMDAEDEEWMRKHSRNFEITELQFEEMMDRLEKGSGQQVVTLKEAKLLLKEDDDLIIAVYDYWLNKRLKSVTGCGLIPNVRQEKRDGSTSNNPYVAFRRRTEKMQTRKNRKNDEASYEKMLKLRRDLNRAVTLLEMVKRREKSKKEAVHLTLEIFEKRYQMDDFSGTILAECEELSRRQPSFTIPAIPSANQFSTWALKAEAGLKKKREYKKRKHKEEKKLRQASTSSIGDVEPPRFPTIRCSEEELSPQVQSISDHEEDVDPDGIFAFRRKKGCQYVAPHPDLVQGWPWSDDPPRGVTDNRYRYSCTSLKEPRRCIGLARRRVGRGGRILLDRAWTPFQDYKKLDSALSNPPSQQTSPLRSPSASSSQTSLPLSFLLDEIRSKRMLHYRPKTPLLTPQQPITMTSSSPFPPLQVPTEGDHKPGSRSFLSTTTTSTNKFPQPMLTDTRVDAALPTAPTQQTLPSLALTASSEPIATQLSLTTEFQDLQSVEVDVVNSSDSSTDLNLSFGSQPTSRFTLDASRDSVQPKSSAVVIEPLPVLVPPSGMFNVKTNHSNTTASSTLLNHRAVLESSTKVPIGHSTAPAATVLQLNYPLGATKIPTSTTTVTILPNTTTSSPMEGAVVSVNNVVMTQPALGAGSVSDPLRKNNLVDRQRNSLEFDGSNVVMSTTQNVSIANAVKRISQTSLDVISRDKHEDSNHTLDTSTACIPSNKSVVMEVT